MKPKSNMSQITMVIIAGLVLFILVGIIFYISKSAIKKTTQQGTKTTQSTAFDAQPIKEFASKCQEKLAKEAINYVGKQGGYIYKSQGGDLIDYGDIEQGAYYILYDYSKVSYNIKQPPIYSVSPYSSVVPEYPCKYFPHPCTNPNSGNFEFDGIFGISNFPPLNVSQGPHSIQSQIENYIDNKMQSCADLTPFIGQGYNFEINKSKTTVTLASSDVRISTFMPIRIFNKATGEQTYIDSFSATINVRLKEIYYFARDIINNDIAKINFNLKDPANDKNSFRINILENVLSKDDIVTITDDKSQISGKQFEYRFARKNRIPALYYYQETLNLAENTPITKDVLLQNKPLQAEDPDEDTLTFTITPNPSPPIILNQPQMVFDVAVSDGQYTDFERITANKI